MQTIQEARSLAIMMKAIGRIAGREVVTLLSDMNQPLGFAVGNSLEVIEAVNTLHDNGPEDFTEHCLVVSAHMLLLGHLVTNLNNGYKMAKSAIASGSAFEKFRVLVTAQGGDVSYIDEPEKFPKARKKESFSATRRGYLSAINARSFGEAAVMLGAGRAQKGDVIDHSVGIIIYTKVGTHVEKGDSLYTIFYNSESRLDEARKMLENAIKVSNNPVAPLPLFYH